MKPTVRLLIGTMMAILLFISAVPHGFTSETVLQRILALQPYVEPQFQNFTIFGGDWKVDDTGVVAVVAGDGPKLVCSLEHFQNLTKGEVSVEIFFPRAERRGYQNAGIILKIREAGVGADHFIGYEIAPSFESQHVTLGFHRHDYQKIADFPITIPQEQWMTLHVLFDETSFEIRLNNQLITKYNTHLAGTPVSGSIALRPWQRLTQYRNLKIKTEAIGNTSHSTWCHRRKNRKRGLPRLPRKIFLPSSF